MAETGAAHLQGIRDDLHCPTCDYNLRGLIGDTVACPECGSQWDVARLVAERWTLPWSRTPGYTSLAMATSPVALLVLVALAAGVGTLERGLPVKAIMTWVAMVLILISVWLLLLFRVHRRFDGMWGVRWCLLAHAVLIGYVVTTWSAFALLMYGLARLILGGWPLIVIPGLMLSIAGFIGLRRLDRAIGQAMIGHHMRGRSAEASKIEPR